MCVLTFSLSVCSLEASGFHFVLVYAEYWAVIVFDYDVTNNT